MKTDQKLKFIKTLSGWSQEEMARHFKVSFVTLNSWINKRSKPQKRHEIKIDDVFKKYTGQSTIPDEILSAKKSWLIKKSKKSKNILKKIESRSDLNDELLLILTYNTNAIEGSTLSEKETAAILFQNSTIPNKTLIEQIEVKNHQAAWKMLLEHVMKKGEINEILVLKLHAILMNGIRDDAGFYRNHGVRIVGSKVVTANPLKIPLLMETLSKTFDQKPKDFLKHTTEIHSHFEKIHPFSDGDGRIGRLVMNAMLLKNNWPPAIIKQKDKMLYYTALEKAQTTEDYSLLEDFIGDAVIEGWKIIK